MKLLPFFRGAILAASALASGLALAADAGPPERPDLDAAFLKRARAVVEPTDDFSKPERFEKLPGGATSVERFDRDAFSQPAANLSFEGRSRFSIGNGVFRKLWVAAPSSTRSSDGLGPLYNARGCQRCHLKDGRGHPPGPDDNDAVSFLIGLSVPALEGTAEEPQTSSEQVIPEPTYGAQLQDFAVGGVAREGRIRIDYEEIEVPLSGGETATLRKPTYTIEDLAYGPLHPDTMISPRIAPQMIGLGLIEAIHDNDIMAKADPDDADGDGISGKANRHIDLATGKAAIGRFGWKAIQPTILQQSSFAFATDMGLDTSVVPEPRGDCTENQEACLAAPIGAGEGEHEVPDDLLALVDFYARHLAVPARRDVDDKEVLRGKEVFYALGCTSCHTPKYVTMDTEAVPPALRRQLIWPYTDVLLHDMGEGLADHRPQGLADGREWRTAPLWGIGLTKQVSDHTLYLHDGRARSILEAILWHGGEAEAARDAVTDLPPEDRAALIRFVESL
ncbi:di-heme oxidoredictase family protein [Afifella sp. IM 167]|uniref:di-heme oxidoreductase family protein n=1 Tax=Afifella sp. IM 167 TaxID=2033586 RepID=UPI001CCF0A7F|nr:di-heme oxidoredictase family protein [Afifella sp. IM 167]MBZ8135320.1 thiol oxidoreductase [Afifella sp. IM 167]